MSNYNSIIEQNNTELEEILESVEALPDAENLDDVMDEQGSIIDQIQAALEGKSAAAPQTATLTVTVNPSSHRFIGVDINGTVYNTETVGTYTLTVLVPCLAGFKYGEYSLTGNYELVYSNGAFGLVDWYLIKGDTTAVSSSGSGEPS